MATDRLYHTISQVAEELGEAPSTLRFWETAFPQLKPVKNSRGTRCYTSRDIELLKRIQYLTRHCGYTLEGAREHLRSRPAEDPRAALTANLTELRRFLVELKERI